MARLNSSIIAAITGATTFLDSKPARDLGVNYAFLDAIEASETQKQGATLTAGAAEDAWAKWRKATLLAVKAGASPETVGVIVDIKVGDNKLRADSVKVYRSTVIGLAGVYAEGLKAEGTLTALAADAGITIKDGDEAKFAENLGRSAATKLIKANKMRSRVTELDQFRALKKAIGEALDSIKANYDDSLKGDELAKAKAAALTEAIEWAREVATMLEVDMSTIPAVTAEASDNDGESVELETGDSEDVRHAA